MNSFIIGAMSNVHPKELQYHLERFNAYMDIMRFRYDINVWFAFLDNQSVLLKAKPEDRAKLCYRIDIQSVDMANLIVADLTVDSIGAGMELQRAVQKKKPVIAIVRKPREPKALEYFLEHGNGEVSRQVVTVGASNLSLMAQGAPCIKKIISYNQVISKQALIKEMTETAATKMKREYAQATMNKLLEDVDLAIQEVLGLTPKTIELQRQLQKLEKEINKENAADITAQMKLIRKKIRMLDKLLKYNPRRMHNMYKKYVDAFPESKRLSPFGRLGERAITIKYAPKKYLTNGSQ